MPYQIFALKWRPQSLDEIVGQDHVVNLLKNSIKKGRLGYAYLFAGPRGVGKTSTARILAKSLNCVKGTSIEPCQSCAPCKEITQCRSLDVIEIDGASNRGIDEIRVLRENVKFSPSASKYKIYIIDEVHMLTNEAFNALLKTLEEPPKFVKFIFATTRVNKIPATIISRCQTLHFRRIPVMDIIKQLKKICAQEEINLEEEIFFSIARASDGSLRDAESILDQLASFSQKGGISLLDISSLLGVVEQQALFELTEKIIHRDAAATLSFLNTMLKEGKDTSVILNNLIEHFRNLIVAKVSASDSTLIDLPQEAIEKLFTQSNAFALEELFSAFNLFVETQEISRRMDASIIPLEIALAKLAREKKGDIPAAVKNPQGCTVKPAAPAGALRSEETNIKAANNLPPEKGIVSSNDCDDNDQAAPHNEADCNLPEAYSKVIESLGKLKMSLASFLAEGTPLKLEKNVLTIAFAASCVLHKETLEKKENRILIEKLFSETLKSSLKIKFVISSANSEQEKPKSDSFIHSALKTFNARLL